MGLQIQLLSLRQTNEEVTAKNKRLQKLVDSKSLLNKTIQQGLGFSLSKCKTEKTTTNQ